MESSTSSTATGPVLPEDEVEKSFCDITLGYILKYTRDAVASGTFEYSGRELTPADLERKLQSLRCTVVGEQFLNELQTTGVLAKDVPVLLQRLHVYLDDMVEDQGSKKPLRGTSPSGQPGSARQTSPEEIVPTIISSDDDLEVAPTSDIRSWPKKAATNANMNAKEQRETTATGVALNGTH
ncbi:hypothetical protein ABW19_dt0200991 [Dactylella cylindrospora]|nr:hypothetical protein ABW19_dt0200991 [Dactylella cylindrospora]